MIACWHTCGSATFDIQLGKAESAQLAGLSYFTTSLSLADAKAAWSSAAER